MSRRRELIGHLSSFVTKRRLGIFDSVLNNRTRYITVVLEDLYQSHNASAVLRTCDCFGIQDVHIIENRNQFRLNPDVALGSAQWLSLYRYSRTNDNTLEALDAIRASGYRLVAATPHKRGVPLHTFDLAAGKTAILFGTELTGLSQQAIRHADEFIFIPMNGFTQSLNISVSAAVILYHLTHVLRNSSISWRLSGREMEDLRLEWLKRSIKKSDAIIREYNKRKKDL